MSIDCVILAGGLGSRMNSSTLKFFQTIADKPLIEYVADACKEIAANSIITVVSKRFKDYGFPLDTKTVVQNRPSGTANAVLQAMPLLNSEYTIVMYGDAFLAERSCLKELAEAPGDAVFIATELPNNLSCMPYGRVITDGDKFQKIVEFKDATDTEKQCNLVNSGIYKFKTSILKKFIDNVQKNNAAKEYYLTDILEILKTNGFEVSALKSQEYRLFHGINTMQDLAVAEEIMQTKLREKFMKSGVKLLAPESVYFSFDTEIENDVVIEQNVVIKGKVKIKSGAKIKAFSYIENCEIMENTSIGPFARLRNDTKLLENSCVGNFVEVKGSVVGSNSKIKHLSYIGDATIGNNSNVGAGTVICNYDGVRKHKTHIGDEAFIGSNSTLISPITINKGAIIAAGSVIDKDVPPDSLAISRSEQKNILGKAAQIWERKRK
ncbi:MAG: bifunctional UDP-N-acetylglucosamine diphosphorylase/glucosamine-1-phosphate N-acetyltransferase GlmU [Holosporales bacterium]|jgi:bifunctional UDP-N-acetylglucosamine pyrophosphorylase/glucosamine-1-phosphate N-acetyltransferase|nr:bifunctional UDP-N-acetylglucosamine diphosphorylase/glucosamine-1-phosphate N-acetyltransferase GlmU [Holosporales bacterium]